MPQNPFQYIFRMVHMDNMPHVIATGLIHRNSKSASGNFKAIGDATLISTRHEKAVTVNDTSERIILGDYIPFYIGVRTPMLYVMQHGGNFVPDKVSAEAICYCVVKLSTLTEKDFSFFFSDGHATDGFTQFYSQNKIDELSQLVDAEAPWAKYWNDENDLDLKRRKQAEVLVQEDIPFDCIAGFAVYNQVAKSKLEQLGVASERIKIKSNYYF